MYVHVCVYVRASYIVICRNIETARHLAKSNSQCKATELLIVDPEMENLGVWKLLYVASSPIHPTVHTDYDKGEGRI